ncbi:MAG: Snf7 family protein [Candidatus Bathyarchaeia archaeon]
MNTGKLIKGWDREPGDSILHRIETKVERTPLKDRIAQAIFRLKTLQQRLEDATGRMQRHDRELFEKCVAAEVGRDNARAAMYANECAEVRKMARILLSSQLAIEQVMLRLETVEEFGDVMVEMAPVAGVIHTLKGRLAGVVPEVSYELNGIGEMLNGVMVDAGEATGASLETTTANEESRRIVGEASSVAEQRMKDRFPDLPTGTRTPSAAEGTLGR